MGMQKLSRRNRIILYIVSALIVMSMIISAIVSFTPSVQTVQTPQAVLPLRATATASR
jgi:hypothetical protein